MSGDPGKRWCAKGEPRAAVADGAGGEGEVPSAGGRAARLEIARGPETTQRLPSHRLGRVQGQHLVGAARQRRRRYDRRRRRGGSLLPAWPT